MYKVVFENDNGKTFEFGPGGGNWFGMNIGDGMDITLGTSQGFAQVGETVETQAVSGRAIDVTGRFIGDIVAGKNAMRNVCAPLASGQLVFNESHYIRVYVKAAPSFSAVKNNGIFKMQFYAPFPFFSTLEECYKSLGSVTPQFRLPINYATPHRFGTKSTNKYMNVYNSGDVRIPFKAVIQSKGTCTNPVITNLLTLETLKLNGTLSAGEFVTIYRDENNVLRAEKTAGTEVTDVITWVDDESALFELAPGDNLISATDEQDGASLSVGFTYNPAVGVLYES